MDLDDQLAALAAGELDDAEARALRARVDADAGLRRRLARLERLEQVLRGWDVDPMTDDERAALDDTVTAALDALGDEPLVDERAPVVDIGPARERHDERRAGAWQAGAGSPPATADGGVVDLGATRRGRGIPTWASGLVAAAAALALVTSVGVGLGGPSGEDADTAAVADRDDAGLAAEDGGADESEERVLADEEAATGPAEDDAAAESAVAAQAFPGPQVASDLVLDATTLADLADLLPLDPYVAALLGDTDGAAGDAVGGPAADSEAAGEPPSDSAEAVLTSPCVRDVLARLAPGGVTAFVGTGTYEGDAAVVVVRLRDVDGVVERTTTAYDTATCSLLAEVVATP